MAAAYCYGTECAVGATGMAAGQYCIGNGCAGNASVCCAGKNCATDWDCFSSTYASNRLFTEACGANVDTEAAIWTTFFDACALDADITITYNNSEGCFVRCDADLHQWFKFYSRRAATEDYANARAEQSDRFDARTEDKDDNMAAVIGLSVAAGVLFVILVAVVALKMKGKSVSGTLSTMNLLNSNF